MKTLQHNQHDKMGRTSRRQPSNHGSGWLKKGMLFLVMVLLGALVHSANYPPQKLSVLGLDGLTTELLITPDSAAEEVPAEIARLFPDEHAARMDQLINAQIDLSSMTKPEPEADDVVIDTHKIFLEIMKENKARGK